MEDNYYEFTHAGMQQNAYHHCCAFKCWYEGELVTYVSGESAEFYLPQLNPDDYEMDIEVSGPDPGK